MNLPQIICSVAAGIVAVIFVILSIIANRTLDSIFVPSSKMWKKLNFTEEEARKNADADEKLKYEKMDAAKKTADHWLGCTAHQDLWTTSFDGLKLHGFLFSTEGNHRYAIIIHGYRGSLRETSVYGMDYHKRGFNVLLPENRASGMSEGKFVSMGSLEKKDVVKWIEKILEIDGEAQIVLHGESMGAATVMMTLGEKLPDNVKAAVSDCGYTSLWDELHYLLKECMHKPTFPILPLAAFYSRLRFGFGFKKTSSIRAVKKTGVPLLIFHGGSDFVVPTKMAKTIYVATASAKDWFIMPSAGHCQSVIVSPDIYWTRVHDFLKSTHFAEGSEG